MVTLKQTAPTFESGVWSGCFVGNVGSRRKTGRKNAWIEKADISGSAASILIFVLYIPPL